MTAEGARHPKKAAAYFAKQSGRSGILRSGPHPRQHRGKRAKASNVVLPDGSKLVDAHEIRIRTTCRNRAGAGAPADVKKARAKSAVKVCCREGALTPVL